jgi:hypothetical protein
VNGRWRVQWACLAAACRDRGICSHCVRVERKGKERKGKENAPGDDMLKINTRKAVFWSGADEPVSWDGEVAIGRLAIGVAVAAGRRKSHVDQRSCHCSRSWTAKGCTGSSVRRRWASEMNTSLDTRAEGRRVHGLRHTFEKTFRTRRPRVDGCMGCATPSRRLSGHGGRGSTGA